MNKVKDLHLRKVKKLHLNVDQEDEVYGDGTVISQDQWIQLVPLVVNYLLYLTSEQFSVRCLSH